jgi:hypothetical protein
MCADCRDRHIAAVRDFALTLRTCGEKLEAGLDQDGMTYIETMEAAEFVVANLFPVLMNCGPTFARNAAYERRRIVMSN